MIMQQIEKFLNTPSKKQKIIVIYGPTGSGKTQMSIDIAKFLDTQIISTDSRQIFQKMNIWTGKITQEEMQGVPHHMIDIIDPKDYFSVGDFTQMSRPIITQLHNNWKIPMLVWGTGLYIDSLIFDFWFSQVAADAELREEFATYSHDELYEKLRTLDPEYAAELHPNNRVYVERALEVKILTGKSKKDIVSPKKTIYDILFVTPEVGNTTDITSESYRQSLYKKIHNRVEKMFTQWLEDEIHSLLAQGYTRNDFWLRSIGYQEFFPYFDWKIEKQQLIADIQAHTRQYAKRQITWFRRYIWM